MAGTFKNRCIGKYMLEKNSNMSRDFIVVRFYNLPHLTLSVSSEALTAD